MDDRAVHPAATGELPAISVWDGPAHELVRTRMLEPPARPGLLGGLDRFEVIRLLGKGGMGTVLLARDTRAGNLVAIKLLNPELIGDARAVHRFLVEAHHMQRLDHPAILRIIEVIDRPEGPAFIVPYMEGGCLAGRIAPERPMDEAAVLAVARPIAEALAYAHSKGISHRDLKPANVLLDAAGRPFLADFGLGRTVYNDSIVDVQRDRAEGTPAYMAPELAEGNAGDTRCDTYAFGAMLYEMLAGRRPYDGACTADLLARIRAGPPPTIHRIRPGASPRLVRVAHWAMARKLHERYADMADVVIDLVRIEQGQEPLGPRRRAIRFTTALRRPINVAAIVVLVILVAWWSAGPTGMNAPLHDLVLAHSFSLHGAEPADVWIAAGPGGDRALFALSGSRLLLLSSRGQPLGELDFAAEHRMNFIIGFAADLDGDGLDEAFIGYAEGESLVIAAVNQDLQVIREFRSPGKSYHHQGRRLAAAVRPASLADLDGDGQCELLAITHSGYGLTGRGVRVFSVKDQRMLWSREIAPEPTNLVLHDVNGDGRLDILLGSHAVSNGHAAVDGTVDSRCYLHAISHDGGLLWTAEAGDEYCAAQPLLADIDSIGTHELLVWITGAPEPRQGASVGRVRRLDRRGNVIAEYDAAAQLHSCMFVKVEGHPRIVATDELGYVHVLGPRLELLHKVRLVTPRHRSVQLHLQATADLKGDGRGQLVFTSVQPGQLTAAGAGGSERKDWKHVFHDHRVLLADAALHLIGEYTVAGSWEEFAGFRVQALDWDRDGRLDLFILAKEALVLKGR